jgi:plastocyanin domain-containing protein
VYLVYNVQKQGIYFLWVGLFKKNTQKTKQNKIYSKINIDKGYLPSSIYAKLAEGSRIKFDIFDNIEEKLRKKR